VSSSSDTFELLDPQVLADPYAVYDALRDRSPVYEMPDIGFFVVTRYDGVLRALRDREAFAIDVGEPDLPGFLRTPEARLVLEERDIELASPLRTDPSRRDALRTLVDGSIADHERDAEPHVRAIVRDLLRGLDGRDTCDFVSELCGPLPMMVMADRLGLPLEDLPMLDHAAQAWVRLICYGMSPEHELEVATRRRELRHYLAEQLEERRRSPRGDLLSDLAGLAACGAPSDGDAWRLAIVEELLVGGNDATTDALASGMLLLLRDPRLLDQLRADASRIGAFVDETLRLESPVAGVLRRTTRDTELLGEKIPKDRLVHLRMAAANRDPRVFEDPHRLDLERPNAGAHLAFGGGSHRCVGESLARLQLRVLFEEVVARWRGFELAVPERELCYLPSFTQRGLRELPLRLRPRQSTDQG
jgi:cytochrome P450